MPVPFARSASQTRPTFSRDFAGLKTLDHGVGPAITFTRGSDATYFNAAGTLTTATTNEPRFDHNPSSGNASLGLLIEEARTNSIRNSQAGGGTNGVIGSGGALPTNWTASGHNTNGVSTEIVGTGAENGLSYIEIKVSGTPTSTSAAFFNFEPSTQIVAANGQSWVASMYCKLANGSLANTSVFLTVSGRATDGSNIAGQATNQSVPTTSSALTSQRYTSAITFSSASVARVLPFFYVNYTSGNPIDITLRIAAPQLEQGAFPTSYIPTTTAAATRSADSAVVTPISSFYNQSEGTLFAEYSPASLPPSGNFPRALSLGNTTNNDNRNVLVYFNSSGSLAHLASYFVSNVQQLDKSTTLGSVGQTFKAASAVATNSGHYALNGLLVGAEDTSITMGADSDFTHLFIARQSSGPVATTAIHIRKIAYYPRRLSNALLQQLTT